MPPGVKVMNSHPQEEDDRYQEDHHAVSDHYKVTSVDTEEDSLLQVNKPGPHDVLLGRGGGTNNHSGNIKFRQLVNEHKMRYLACSKVEKPKVAREVVAIWRKLEPPGRFLARQDDSKRGPGSVKAADNVWVEVGDKKAREKASQCLRERTPDVLPYIKQLREQQDAITERGVSMVQQRMQMHQEQGIRTMNGPSGGMHQQQQQQHSDHHYRLQQQQQLVMGGSGADQHYSSPSSGNHPGQHLQQGYGLSQLSSGNGGMSQLNGGGGLSGNGGLSLDSGHYGGQQNGAALMNGGGGGNSGTAMYMQQNGGGGGNNLSHLMNNGGMSSMSNGYSQQQQQPSQQLGGMNQLGGPLSSQQQQQQPDMNGHLYSNSNTNSAPLHHSVGPSSLSGGMQRTSSGVPVGSLSGGGTGGVSEEDYTDMTDMEYQQMLLIQQQMQVQQLQMQRLQQQRMQRKMQQGGIGPATAAPVTSMGMNGCVANQQQQQPALHGNSSHVVQQQQQLSNSLHGSNSNHGQQLSNSLHGNGAGGSANNQVVQQSNGMMASGMNMSSGINGATSQSYNLMQNDAPNAAPQQPTKSILRQPRYEAEPSSSTGQQSSRYNDMSQQERPIHVPSAAAASPSPASGGEGSPSDSKPAAVASAAPASSKPSHTAKRSREVTRASDMIALHSSQDNGELTIEEYRQQLERYLESNRSSGQGADAAQLDHNNEDHPYNVDDDDDDHSDLEDDWEKEKEKAYKQQQQERSKSRVLSRANSGHSFMSAKTTKSSKSASMSITSGFSGLSDLMSTGTRERKMNQSRSVGSNRSLMSELTDLSSHIDDLSIYDDN